MSNLNKTWTLLPEEEEEDNAMDIDCSTNQFINQNANKTTLLDEEMFVDVVNTPCKLDESNNNQTRVLNETINLKENLVINYNYDLSKISIEMINLNDRFNSEILNKNCDSLFDETVNGLEFANGDPILNSNPTSPTLSKKQINTTVCIEENNIFIKPKSPLSSSLSASIDNLDKLNDFNPCSVPKTFDLFINDLKKSSSTFTLNSLNSNSQNSILNQQTSSINKRFLTSSIDKDLNKDLDSKLKLNNNNNLKLKEVQNLAINKKSDIKTSSPMKVKKLINTTIDLNKTNKIVSNESLNESETSLSLSQSSSIANFAFGQINDDEPRTVFNTTYTSWSTSDNQLQIDAFKQLNSKYNTNSTVVLNRTQDMNNNSSKDDLNKTKDIIHDDEIANNLNKTRDIGTNKQKVLNVTQDLESNDKISNLVKPSASSQLRRVSSIQSTTRPSSIYQKSKLLVSKPTQPQVPSPTQSQTKLQPTISKVSKLAQPTVTQQTTEKPKLAIPKVNINKQSSPPGQKSPNSLLQRPNSLTTKPNNLNSNPAQINLNRLSSTSSSSSTSTSSSSSLKENKKSPTALPASSTAISTASQLKSPNSKLTQISQNTLSKLKQPVSLAQSGLPVKAISNLPVNKVETNINTQKSGLKPPTQIPTFKIPSSIPTLRNTTNQVKK